MTLNSLPPWPARVLGKYIIHLRTHFASRISRKTGWGKNELAMEFEQAITEALIDTIDDFGKEETDESG